jgi:Holliday junction resolvase
MLEQARQKKISDRLKKEGWIVVKLIKTTMNGIPDLMALRNGETLFVEVKQPKGKLAPIQELRIQELKDQGFRVEVWIDYEINFVK